MSFEDSLEIMNYIEKFAEIIEFTCMDCVHDQNSFKDKITRLKVMHPCDIDRTHKSIVEINNIVDGE